MEEGGTQKFVYQKWLFRFVNFVLYHDGHFGLGRGGGRGSPLLLQCVAIPILPWGPQWVWFASPQSAPTAPATTAFIALSSMCQLTLRLSACLSAQWPGSGPRTLPHLSTVPARLSPVGLWLWGCKHSARLTPLRLVDQHVGPFLDGAKGRTCRSGVIRGQALASAGPSQPCLSTAHVWSLGPKV